MSDASVIVTRDSRHTSRVSHGTHPRPTPARPVPSYLVVTSVGGFSGQPNPNRHLANATIGDDSESVA